MTLAIAFSSVDVIIHAGQAEWWQIVATATPFATTTALVLAVAVACYPARRRNSSPTTMWTEWWDRAEWALNMALDENPERRRVGLAALEQLSASGPMGKEDAQILAEAQAVLKRP